MARTLSGIIPSTGLPSGTVLPITVSLWARPTSVVGPQYLLGSFFSPIFFSSYFALRIQDATTFYADSYASPTVSASIAGTITAGQWNHFGAVYTSTTSRQAFLNGVAGTINTQSGSAIGSITLTLGGGYTAGPPEGTLGTSFAGDMAEFAIWSVALDATELLALSRGVSAALIRPTALICYWPLIGGKNYWPESNQRSGGGLGVGSQITFDAALGLITSSSPMSWSHTCTGINRALVVGAYAGSDLGVTATYAGVTMPFVAKQLLSSGAVMYLFVLANPASGANTVLVTNAGYGRSMSFTGVNQVQPVEGIPVTAAAATGTTISVSVVTVGQSALPIAFFRNAADNAATGGGGGSTILRGIDGSNSIILATLSASLFNPTSQALTYNWTGSGENAAIGCVLSNYGPPAAPHPRIFYPTSTFFNSYHKYFLTGTTKNAVGIRLAGCTVRIFRTSDNTIVATTTSDSSGNFSAQVPGDSIPVYAVATLAGIPNVEGTTINTLVGV
jgi:hypothetical protein